MFRFFLIFGLISYVLYKIGGFFFRVGAASQNRNYPPRQPQPNHEPKPKKETKGGSIKGGEYIDYEEVK
jgi:hypothetical protein